MSEIQTTWQKLLRGTLALLLVLLVLWVVFSFFLGILEFLVCVVELLFAFVLPPHSVLSVAPDIMNGAVISGGSLLALSAFSPAILDEFSAIEPKHNAVLTYILKNKVLSRVYPALSIPCLIFSCIEISRSAWLLFN